MPKISVNKATKLGLKSGEVHSIVAPKDLFDLKDAKKWLKKHDFKTGHRETVSSWRFNQLPEVSGARFGSKKIQNGMTFIFQYWN